MGLAVESRDRYLSSLGLFLPLAIGTCSFLSLAPEVSFPFCGCPSVDLLWASATVTLRHPDCMGMTAMETQQEGPRAQRYLDQAGEPLDFSLSQQDQPQ